MSACEGNQGFRIWNRRAWIDTKMWCHMLPQHKQLFSTPAVVFCCIWNYLNVEIFREKHILNGIYAKVISKCLALCLALFLWHKMNKLMIQVTLSLWSSHSFSFSVSGRRIKPLFYFFSKIDDRSSSFLVTVLESKGWSQTKCFRTIQF